VPQPLFDLRVFTTIDAVAEWLPREHRSRTGVWVSRDEIAQLLAEGKRWHTEATA
jgi:hypothetical protein